MKAEQHIKTICTTAAATAAIVLAGFWPAFLNGAGDGNAVSPTIKTPRFVSGTVEFTVALPEGSSFKAGDEPAFDFVAVNTGDQPATAAVEAVMMSTSVPSRMSRSGARQARVWQEPLTVSLEPHETKTFRKEVHTELPGNSKMDIYLYSSADTRNSPMVSILAFSTAPDTVTIR